MSFQRPSSRLAHLKTASSGGGSLFTLGKQGLSSSVLGVSAAGSTTERSQLSSRAETPNIQLSSRPQTPVSQGSISPTRFASPIPTSESISGGNKFSNSSAYPQKIQTQSDKTSLSNAYPTIQETIPLAQTPFSQASGHEDISTGSKQKAVRFKRPTGDDDVSFEPYKGHFSPSTSSFSARRSSFSNGNASSNRLNSHNSSTSSTMAKSPQSTSIESNDANNYQKITPSATTFSDAYAPSSSTFSSLKPTSASSSGGGQPSFPSFQSPTSAYQTSTSVIPSASSTPVSSAAPPTFSSMAPSTFAPPQSPIQQGSDPFGFDDSPLLFPDDMPEEDELSNMAVLGFSVKKKNNNKSAKNEPLTEKKEVFASDATRSPRNVIGQTERRDSNSRGAGSSISEPQANGNSPALSRSSSSMNDITISIPSLPLAASSESFPPVMPSQPSLTANAQQSARSQQQPSATPKRRGRPMSVPRSSTPASTPTPTQSSSSSNTTKHSNAQAASQLAPFPLLLSPSTAPDSSVFTRRRSVSSVSDVSTVSAPSTPPLSSIAAQSTSTNSKRPLTAMSSLSPTQPSFGTQPTSARSRFETTSQNTPSDYQKDLEKKTKASQRATSSATSENKENRNLASSSSNEDQKNLTVESTISGKFSSAPKQTPVTSPSSQLQSDSQNLIANSSESEANKSEEPQQPASTSPFQAPQPLSGLSSDASQASSTPEPMANSSQISNTPISSPNNSTSFSTPPPKSPQSKSVSPVSVPDKQPKKQASQQPVQPKQSAISGLTKKGSQKIAKEQTSSSSLKPHALSSVSSCPSVSPRGSASSNCPRCAALQKQIAALKSENKRLKEEIAILKEVDESEQKELIGDEGEKSQNKSLTIADQLKSLTLEVSRMKQENERLKNNGSKSMQERNNTSEDSGDDELTTKLVKQLRKEQKQREELAMDVKELQKLLQERESSKERSREDEKKKKAHKKRKMPSEKRRKGRSVLSSPSSSSDDSFDEDSGKDSDSVDSTDSSHQRKGSILKRKSKKEKEIEKEKEIKEAISEQKRQLELMSQQLESERSDLAKNREKIQRMAEEAAEEKKKAQLEKERYLALIQLHSDAIASDPTQTRILSHHQSLLDQAEEQSKYQEKAAAELALKENELNKHFASLSALSGAVAAKSREVKEKEEMLNKEKDALDEKKKELNERMKEAADMKEQLLAEQDKLRSELEAAKRKMKLAIQKEREAEEKSISLSLQKSQLLEQQRKSTKEKQTTETKKIALMREAMEQLQKENVELKMSRISEDEKEQVSSSDSSTQNDSEDSASDLLLTDRAVGKKKKTRIKAKERASRRSGISNKRNSFVSHRDDTRQKNSRSLLSSSVFITPRRQISSSSLSPPHRYSFSRFQTPERSSTSHFAHSSASLTRAFPDNDSFAPKLASSQLSTSFHSLFSQLVDDTERITKAMNGIGLMARNERSSLISSKAPMNTKDSLLSSNLTSAPFHSLRTASSVMPNSTTSASLRSSFIPSQTFKQPQFFSSSNLRNQLISPQLSAFFVPPHAVQSISSSHSSTPDFSKSSLQPIPSEERSDRVSASTQFQSQSLSHSRDEYSDNTKEDTSSSNKQPPEVPRLKLSSKHAHSSHLESARSFEESPITDTESEEPSNSPQKLEAVLHCKDEIINDLHTPDRQHQTLDTESFEDFTSNNTNYNTLNPPQRTISPRFYHNISS
ncbi:uncharacterized protein MONOS_4867 [Monocercomonoides exilis]|uniref:uncharacterized protein n=1 Tax=Monocercomonoides exilis TaxID=2049356 RepID=UPI003559C5C1|nr:hypothetical protein MONOS_4867 [Monocercomonoides exilis]|eukprot:MONOS_4867.1-p1 / transcript=MONOS_4867.1 / gene=MONOS_4867 / organism=Monocercomonoides_exilis_PA203 / gene_product=unspecified product / transcript_product=unspecified product / location=Mono_scaffold00135:106214-111532(+) / protein_length=1704 / sequence_SO=supercontig / SO=protein_coding / is_pseudo=false